MNSQEFAEKIDLVLYRSPAPVGRESGDFPTSHEVSICENVVEVRWMRESNALGMSHLHGAHMTVERTKAGWVYPGSPIYWTAEDYRSWFPGFVRQARAGDEFNPTRFIQYFCAASPG